MGEAVEVLKWIDSRTISKQKYEALNDEERIGKYPTGILKQDENKAEYCASYQEVVNRLQGK